MFKPKLSVVMPTKNRSHYLHEAIESIIKQTFKDWELIVIDDNSTEDIKTVVNSFNDKRIKYYRLKNGTGISVARNFGNKKAMANIIVVADSDDTNYPLRLKETYAYFKKYPKIDVLYGILDKFRNKEKKRIRRYSQPFNKQLLRQVNFIPHGASAYKKTTFFKVGGYDKDLKISEDYDLWLSFADYNANFAYIKKIIYSARVHDGSYGKKHGKNLKNYIKKIRKKHKQKKSDLSIKILKKLANKETYDHFITPKRIKIWGLHK